jgi:hypothetical protein
VDPCERSGRFGLVNVPVKLYGATEDHDVPLHQVHDADGGRIRYQRVCELDSDVVPNEHIDRAYDDGEHTVVLTEDDLVGLPAERDRDRDLDRGAGRPTSTRRSCAGSSRRRSSVASRSTRRRPSASGPRSRAPT